MRPMRTTVLIAASIISLMAGAPSALADFNMTSGQTYLAVTNGSGKSCYIGRAPSTYSRVSGSFRALMTFGEIWEGGRYDLSGEALLTFSSATAGRIAFGQQTGVAADFANPIFQGFTETYNATVKTLTVRYSILFPGCTQAVIAVYHGI